MTAIPWNVLSESHSSQRLCSRAYWPENDFLSSLQLPSSAWETLLGYICIFFSLESLLQLYPQCSNPCTSLERSCASWNWLITSQRSRKPTMSAECLASQDCLVDMISVTHSVFWSGMFCFIIIWAYLICTMCLFGNGGRYIQHV